MDRCRGTGKAGMGEIARPLAGETANDARLASLGMKFTAP